MTKPTTARTPVWLPPISFVAFALVIFIISFCWELTPFILAGQALLLFVLLRAFCYWPPMRRWVAAMPVPHRIAFAFLGSGMILGHFTVNARMFYPFVAWEIFPRVREENPVRCPAFIATTASGKKVRLLTEQLFPSIVQIDPMEAFNDPKLYPPGTLDHLASVLVGAYNERHPDDPAQQVDLMLLTVNLHPAATSWGDLPTCQLLKHYTVSLARSN